jgi:sigma-54 dependent transcriptional regulator, acetoin dehydrogenase operon transcriptional activator AcoR
VAPDRRTRTADDASAPAGDPQRAYLVSAIACERPTVAPRRLALDGVTEVALSGRSPAAVTRTGDALAIDCDDAWASTRHAAIRKSFGRWLVEDLGSKNGTLVNGERVTRHTLGDGDLVEIGRSTWLFREQPGAPTDASADLAAPFVTLHPPLEDALARAIAGLRAELPVLVRGESGSGKERFVAAAHAGTHRTGALVAVNCGALPAQLVEAELFGHKKGAFSGALDDRVGYIRAADHGTLFLDEIGDMPLAAQTALLRTLAERTVTPVGAERPITVDFAVVAATHRDLGGDAFRADLLARLSGVTIAIPPLRERREDIAAFVARTLARVAPSATLAPDAARAILRAPWPLNVRELEHAVAAAAIRARGPIALADLALDAPAPSPPEVLSHEDAALRAQLVDALSRAAGNISAVARELGRDRKQIYRWIERFGIDERDPR